ncbi:23S rRNA (guanosine(2251)-2'-O)-methyltransferase RlmB [endosymbiont of Ridgeia piscesae]|jgi:23S rRNA (guanosine2251-2'-O)-methyltransferase|uniref:23S rRNA (guanosine-2'-O-)-methyltransferase RlmB n=1 Tax=endosymbiont of Ridgeia piscesae TaxID=54398 RepID=A0A0T5Z7M6_9GAMM|nr:23S rRNA (guanosine(2251)-2'-O)-methyltransferase RlmB [endosymbiont of Ridgeia piscesae]KRT55487.1 23S rRNA Gm-2251 2'-O-methyltransferase [endosymbiont of Ridgeia piscesae]KRT58919.1 23S rRNA Gm-2251 2'-O-methyltransferase [endosymbiont of Ridgeia piscesae]
MPETQLIIGLHAVRTALKHGDAVTEILLESRRRDARIKEVLNLARQAGLKPRQVEGEELDRLAQGGNHQGVAAYTRAPAVMDEAFLKQLLAGLDLPPFLLVLDGVQDPHNLGACLRTADAAGVQAVIAPRDKSVGLTPVACKVASGAAETVPFIQVTNLSRTLKWLQQQGVWLIGTAGEAESELYQADLKGPLAIVMGSEGKGLRRLTREQCDSLIKLPMLGAVESLNVSVATGITLYEALRQRS